MNNQFTNDAGQYDSYAWPGGYPLYYLTVDYGVLCPTCANENKELIAQATSNSQEDKQWHIIAQEINYEDMDLICDNCYKQIESAYGE